jgi:hypothetical protein
MDTGAPTNAAPVVTITYGAGQTFPAWMIKSWDQRCSSLRRAAQAPEFEHQWPDAQPENAGEELRASVYPASTRRRQRTPDTFLKGRAELLRAEAVTPSPDAGTRKLSWSAIVTKGVRSGCFRGAFLNSFQHPM